MDKPKMPEGRVFKEGEDPDKARAKGQTEIKLTDEMKATLEGLKEKEVEEYELESKRQQLERIINSSPATIGDLKEMEERIMKEIKSIKDRLFGTVR